MVPGLVVARDRPVPEAVKLKVELVRPSMATLPPPLCAIHEVLPEPSVEST